MESLGDPVHEGGATKDHKFIVFESQLMPLFQRCHSCSLEVKLETSIRGTLLVVNGICPDEHVLHWQSQPLVRVWQLGICCYLQLFYSVVSPSLVRHALFLINSFLTRMRTDLF